MEEALQELHTVKFWILALVSVFLGIITNFITDWIKALFRSSRLINLTSDLSKTDTQLNLYFISLIISLNILSLFSMLLLDYYLFSQLMAWFFAIDRMLRLRRILFKKLPIDDPNKELTIKYSSILIFINTYLILFGIPRIIYWMIEFNFITSMQSSAIIIFGHLAYWFISNHRQKIKTDKI